MIAGDLDLDNFMPSIVNNFPDSNVTMKTTDIGRKCIIIKDPIEKIKLVKVDDTIDCDLEPSMKLTLYKTMGFAYLDMCFDIDIDLLNKLIALDKNLLNMIMGSGKIQDNDGKEKNFTSVLLPLFLNKLYGKGASGFSENLEVDITQISYKLNNFKKKFSIKPILVGMELAVNTNVHACSYALIEDFDDQLKVDSNWKNMSNKENSIYESNLSWFRVCKNKKLLKSLNHFNFIYHYNRAISQQFVEGTKAWLQYLGEAVSNIRENVADDNSNPYYWKELKRRIEILDLNFLEFNTYVIQKMDLPSANHLDLHLKKEYFKEIVKFDKDRRDKLFKYLNEIRTAIVNLATPGHTHDEMFLQQETEKVNERILMLSFIAMSIPTIGAILSPGISNSVKAIAGFGVFLLPISYLLVRNFIKKNRFSKNKQLEFIRIISGLENELKEFKDRMKDVENVEKMPVEFKQQIQDVFNKMIKEREERIEILKKES